MLGLVTVCMAKPEKSRKGSLSLHRALACTDSTEKEKSYFIMSVYESILSHVSSDQMTKIHLPACVYVVIHKHNDVKPA